MNPDVRVNADLKHAIGARVAVPTKTKDNSAAEAHMTTIEKSGQRVKAYFQDPNVRYAAWKPHCAGAIRWKKASRLLPEY